MLMQLHYTIHAIRPGILYKYHAMEPETLKDLHPKAAGRLMTESVPTTHPSATIAEVESFLLTNAAKLTTINYIYVLDKERRLSGVLSVKEVFRSPKHTPVAQVMRRDLVTVRPHTEAERVALLAIDRNLKEIPVVDAAGRFLGVVPSDAILNILHQKNVEDVLKFAGVHRFENSAREILTASAGTHLKKRLPWLLLGLVGGVAAAMLVDIFGETLRLQLILASFIPAIVYIADAVGTQTQTIFIRSLSLDPKLNIANYATRETKIAAAIAGTLGVMMYGIAMVFWPLQNVPIILGLSFSLTILAAVAVAILLPWFFNRIKIDPAIASGPFATVIRDIMSLAIYLTVATVIIS